jgi:hypothetical protein
LGRLWPDPEYPDEPYWTEEDYSKVMAYTEYDAEICSRCGTREEDWVDENGIPLTPPRLFADTHKCYGCEQLEHMSESIPHESAKGVRPILKRFIIGIHDRISDSS